MTNKDQLTIGSRGSRLALWQAEWVKARLLATHPGLAVHITIIKTTGDVLTEAPLARIGGKGVFTKELEEALLDSRIDLAVHSLKDLPTQLPAGLGLAAITEREDARDALIMRAESSEETPSIARLPRGAVVGTSSLRRLAQLKHLRPDLGIKDLRGNVDTRLRKLDAGDYDAIILAAAGLRRLGFAARIGATLDADEMVPAVGQGALGIETRAADQRVRDLLAPLDHPPTHAACAAERSLLRSLGGGCQVPIAAHARVSEGRLQMVGLVAGLSGDTVIRETHGGDAREAERLGADLAARLRARGAEALLSGLVTTSAEATRPD